MCGLPDVLEFTTSIQREAGTQISQTTFMMKELKEMLDGNTCPIRTDEMDKNGAVMTEDTLLVDLTFEAQRVLDVLVEMLI